MTVDKISTHGNSADVTFSDATSSVYDLVIGADGVASKVRSLAFPHMRPPAFTGQGCWRVTSPRPPGMERGEFYLGHTYPAGITTCSPNSVYLWMLTPDPLQAFIPEEEVRDRLREQVADFGGTLRGYAII